MLNGHNVLSTEAMVGGRGRTGGVSDHTRKECHVSVGLLGVRLQVY